MGDNVSNNEYKRIGDRIRANSKDISSSDMFALQNLRISYRDDLSCIFNDIVALTKSVDRKAIITCRIKRIESIISKLLRLPNTQLNTMADIAGCRCIMSSVEKIYKLKDVISKKFYVTKERDYVKYPKDDGYRSLHLIVKSPLDPRKKIEIQLRCRAQHNWATLVEITDVLFETKVKEYGDNVELARFHKLLSIESKDLERENMEEIIRIARKYSYFKKISGIFNENYIEVRNMWNNLNTRKNPLFLVATGKDGHPAISVYSSFEKAENEYYNLYSNNDGKNIVLMHANNADFEQVSMAYSNYFLTSNELFYNCYDILSRLVISYYSDNKPFCFGRVYPFFLNFTQQILEDNMFEFVLFNTKKGKMKSLKKQKEWMNSIGKKLKKTTKIFLRTQKQTRFSNKRLRCSIIKLISIWLFKKRLQAALKKEK